MIGTLVVLLQQQGDLARHVQHYGPADPLAREDQVPVEHELRVLFDRDLQARLTDGVGCTTRGPVFASDQGDTRRKARCCAVAEVLREGIAAAGCAGTGQGQAPSRDDEVTALENAAPVVNAKAIPDVLSALDVAVDSNRHVEPLQLPHQSRQYRLRLARFRPDPEAVVDHRRYSRFRERTRAAGLRPAARAPGP